MKPTSLAKGINRALEKLIEISDQDSPIIVAMGSGYCFAAYNDGELVADLKEFKEATHKLALDMAFLMRRASKKHNKNAKRASA